MSSPDAFVGSPSAAYRADMLGRDAPFGRDDEWLAAATSLHRAAGASDEHRQVHLADAVGIATQLVGHERVDRFVRYHWRGDRSSVESLVVLADDMHEAGALHLAAVTFDDVLRATPGLTRLERGRILALRARVEWKLGGLDDAIDRYRYIASLGRSAKSPELLARAEVGLIPIAQIRGNLPQLREHASRAASLTERHGLDSIGHLAWQGMTIAEAKEGHYQAALPAAWKAMQLAAGEAALECSALVNLGQLALEAGHPALARAAFAAVMTRVPPIRSLFPALGGLALASALTGAESTAEWSVREVWRARDARVPQYQLAAALLECAVALLEMRRGSEAERFRIAGSELAHAHGFHELVFRADSLAAGTKPQRAAPARFDDAATDVARQVASLEPDRLPARLEFEPAGA